MRQQIASAVNLIISDPAPDGTRRVTHHRGWGMEGDVVSLRTSSCSNAEASDETEKVCGLPGDGDRPKCCDRLAVARHPAAVDMVSESTGKPWPQRNHAS